MRSFRSIAGEPLRDLVTKSANDGTPDLTIVIPVYNAASSLETTMHDLLGQTLENIELICVDDGSDDGSLRVLQSYAEQDSRVACIALEHRGAGRARNEGLIHAKGRYIAFWDADDRYHCEMAQSMVDQMDRDSSEVAVCEMETLDVKSGRRAAFRPFPANVREGTYNREVFGNLLFSICSPNPCNKVFRTDFIRELDVSFQELDNTNDLFFVCAACAASRRITVLRKRLFIYRVNHGGSIQDSYSRNPFCSIIACITLYEWLKKNFLLDESILQSFKQVAMRSATASIRKGVEDGSSFRELCYQYAYTLHDVWGFSPDLCTTESRKYEFFYWVILRSSCRQLRFALLPISEKRSFSIIEKIAIGARLILAVIKTSLLRERRIAHSYGDARINIECLLAGVPLSEWAAVLNDAFADMLWHDKTKRGGVLLAYEHLALVSGAIKHTRSAVVVGVFPEFREAA